MANPTIPPWCRWRLIVELTVDKTIASQSFSTPLAASDTIDYQFVVTNTGNVDIDAVAPVDPGPEFNGNAATGAALSFATTDDTDLEPSEFATFTATYVLTATDVANLRTAADPTDQIVNIADATGTPPSGTTLETVTSSTNTGISPAPGITLVKAITDVVDVNGNGLFGDVGDTIVYDLTVTNTGNTSLAGVTLTDAKLGLTDVAVVETDLAPEAVGVLADQNYTITPADVAAGTVENTATATGSPVATAADGTPDVTTPLENPDGSSLADVEDISGTDTQPELDADGNPVPAETPGAETDDPTVLTLPVPAPAMTLVKAITDVVDVNGNGLFGDVGDTIVYDLTVTNTGNTSLAGVTLTDAKLGLTDVAVVETDLAPEAVGVLADQNYTITPADVAAGTVENTATATGSPVATAADGTPDVTTPLENPDGSSLADVEDISGTDTQPELDADGNPVPAETPGAETDDPTVLTLPVPAPGITLVKAITDVVDVNGNGLFGDVGDTIVYDLTVTNTGNTSLAGVTLTDAKLGLTDVAVVETDLAPEAVGVLADQNYTITPADVAAGTVENTATATGSPVATAADGTPDVTTPLENPDGSSLADVEDISGTDTQPELDADGNPVPAETPGAETDDPTVLTLPVPAPGITLVKAITDVVDVNGNGLFGDVGDTIVYDLTVTNTGNTSLAGVTLTDAKLGLTDVAVVETDLAPEAVGVLADQNYTITPADVAAGTVENTATATGSPVATAADGTPDVTTPLENPDGSSLADVEDISGTDTQPELDADGNPVPAETPGAETDDPTVLTLPVPAPGITLVKAITDVVDVNGNGLFGDVGDTIVYDLTVTNTGNTSLAGVTLTDAKLGLTDVAVVETDLAPEAVGVLADQNYTITPADVAAGTVENTATATGSPVATAADGTPDVTTPLENPDGSSLADVEDISGTDTQPELDADGNPVPAETPGAETDDPTVLTLPVPAPGITLVKAITDVVDVNGNGLFGDVGDTIVYDLTVTNTGNTSLAGVTLTDAKLGLTDVAVVETDLAPEAVGVLADQNYTITPADVAAGTVENTATATGSPVATAADGTPDVTTPLENPDGSSLADVEDISGTDTQPELDADGNPVPAETPGAETDDPTVLTLPVPAPGITLVKAITDVVDVNGNGLFGDVGDTIVYDLTVTNTGNTSLAGVTLTDAKLGLTDVAVVETDLAPEAVGVLADQNYTITPADVAAGTVENTATATGSPVATAADGTPDVTTPLENPDGSSLADVEDISGTDTQPELDADGNPVPAETPGAETDDPTVLTLPVPAPGITLVKAITDVVDVNGNGLFGDVGDTIVYDLTVTNTGNTSLAGVTLTDAKLGLTDVAVVETDLAPEAVGVLADQNYTITPADVAAGTVENTATATGSPVATAADGTPDVTTPLENPDGSSLADVEDISGTDTQPELDADGNPVPAETPGAETDDPTVLTLPVPAPGITLVKAITDVVDVNGNGLFGDVGDTIVYDLTVTNTGNTSLAGVTLTDAKLGLTDVAVVETDLAPEAVGVLADQNYTITPADVAAGTVENTATATGSPVATAADGTPDVTTPLENPDGSSLADVEDISGTDTQPELDADGNPVPAETPGAETDDPTVLTLPVPAPGITLVKAVTAFEDTNGNTALGDIGDQILYRFEVTNTGNTSLSNVTVTDPLLGIADVFVTPNILQPGQSALLENQTLVISTEQFSEGFVENSATTSGLVVATGPDGEPDPSTPLVGIDGTPLTVDDTSDTGSEPDANDDGTIVAIDNPASVGTGDDPTVINLPSPSLEVVKTVEEIAILFPTIEQVTFAIEVTNTGNIIQTGIDVRDDLVAFVAPATLVSDAFPATVVASGFTDGAANAGFDGVNGHCVVVWQSDTCPE